eukprot:TRINITY_DN7902_c0_g1_i2.p1 TRINITY_DN7902_c0_g1~~TRINITY_DN7902_c0_g1_i2.p1  ORF type:complete len:760 (+),score=58.41 TRINITY_DN7902_c0_g1_i2:1988-4267(+)
MAVLHLCQVVKNRKTQFFFTTGTEIRAFCEENKGMFGQLRLEKCQQQDYFHAQYTLCGCSKTVMPWLPKPVTPVRLRSPAPLFSSKSIKKVPLGTVFDFQLFKNSLCQPYRVFLTREGKIMAEKAKTVKLDIGTIYQKNANGAYYFRYQINGQRKAVSLKTKNQKEAIAKAEELLPVVNATSTEVISAHVKQARGLATRKKTLPLSKIWEVYCQHPERATPATVNERVAYEATLNEFIKFIDADNMDINNITPEVVDKFASHMRKTGIAVDTHNRKIKRLKKIFSVLHEYYEGDNPFTAKSLQRKAREEQEHMVRRMSFTREQEQQLLNVLEDAKYKVMNKPEVRVIYHLGMFTGQRMKDCVLLRWDKVDLKRRRIWVKQFKTGKEVTIPIAPKLLEVLKEARDWQSNHYVCPNIAKRYNTVDKRGKNIGSNLVNVDAIRVIKWIGLEPAVEVPERKRKVTVYGFHSLRHSFVSHCAEAGVPKAVVLSIIGTNSEIVDKHYTHIGEEAQEKAIMAISGTYTPISDRERIANALEFINSCNDKSDAILHIKNILCGNQIYHLIGAILPLWAPNKQHLQQNKCRDDIDSQAIRLDFQGTQSDANLCEMDLMEYTSSLKSPSSACHRSVKMYQDWSNQNVPPLDSKTLYCSLVKPEVSKGGCYGQLWFIVMVMSRSKVRITLSRRNMFARTYGYVIPTRQSEFTTSECTKLLFMSERNRVGSVLSGDTFLTKKHPIRNGEIPTCSSRSTGSAATPEYGLGRC